MVVTKIAASNCVLNNSYHVYEVGVAAVVDARIKSRFKRGLDSQGHIALFLPTYSSTE